MALMAVPAAAGTLAWGYVTTPQATNQQLQDSTDVDILVAAPDGMTLFAYSNTLPAGGTGHTLYKSTDGGVKWTTTNIGTGLEGDIDGSAAEDAQDDVVAMAVSPNYATDSVVVAAIHDMVFRSQNGGATWGQVSTAGLVAASGVGSAVGDPVITSLDVAQYYTGGELAILVGTADPTAAQFGGVYLCRLDTWTWADQTAGALDIYAVAFSPNHQGDAQILAVGAPAAGGNAILTTKFAANAFAADVLNANIGTIDETEMAGAVIAFPDDYEWSSMNRVFVGTNSTDATLDDVYRVHGGLPGGASTAYDLNVNGTTTETNVWSIAIDGSTVGASVFVGQAGSTNVKRTADPSVSTVTWSSATKGPVGDAAAPNVIVLLAPDYATSMKVMAGTGGANSCFSVSEDGGAIFNGVALIDVSALANLSYVDLAMVDANTMYLIVMDDADASGTVTLNDVQHLFKTTDGGTSYIRVQQKLTTAALDALTNVEVSPNYATDSTLYVAENNTRLWKSTDGGGRFIGLAAPAAITALAVVDGSTYFTGHAALVYKSGHWNSGTVTGNAVSIAVSPEFATDDTVAVGCSDGNVYVSSNASATSGVTYTRQGAAPSLGAAGNVIVAFDPAYATNSTIYGGSAIAAQGVKRFVVGTSSAWTALDAGNACAGLVVSADGTLYNANPAAAASVQRILNPTATAPTVETMGAASMPAGAVMQSLAYQPGSNVLYTLVNSIAVPPTAYPHGFSLLTYTDTFAITPTIAGPADGAADVSATPSLSWEAITAPAGTVVTYTVTIGTDANFAGIAWGPTNTTGTQLVVPAGNLTAGRTYWWRVQVTAGNPLTTQRATRTFTVALGATAQNAAVSAPAPGATGVSTTPNFQWTVVGGATGYRINLATDAGFTNILANKLLDTNVWTYDGALEASTTYYWRVMAISPNTESTWSTGVFTTAAPATPPITVEPPAPAPTITITQPAPPPATTITVSQPAPPAATTISIPPAPAPTTITPGWIYAIIVVGAVLVIAVVVLIVRTRRVV
jgi:hypothetical protein